MAQKIRLSLQFKFLIAIVLIVLPAMGIVFLWAGIQNERQALDQVLNQARIVSRQIILTRHWVTDCTSLMVKENSPGEKDTGHFFMDRMQTPRGPFRRFTPSMVTKKLSEYSEKQDLYRFHLVSLHPLNPENRPDAFEASALNRFKSRGLSEFYRITHESGQEELHYMVPLHLEKGCLKCHQPGIQGSDHDIWGGLSIFLPIDELGTAIETFNLNLVLAGTGLVSLTIVMLFFLLRRLVIQPLQDMEAVAGQLAGGDLKARLKISTGDELESLGRAFNSMVGEIEAGKDRLEARVNQATADLAKANQELRTLDELKSNFLANMSHELRSPLTSIRGGLDYLQRTLRKEENRHYLRIMDKNVNRLIRLVSDLFDFTKLEAKKVDWSFSQENLCLLIEEVIDILSYLSLEKNVDVVFENPGDIVFNMDRDRMEQVLVNLLDNAIKYSRPETEVRISLKAQQEEVMVSVYNQGPGIPEDKLDSIFDKFSTVPCGRQGRTEGTGLGLAICKAIVEAHGGRIRAESVPGESCCICFTLPNPSPSTAAKQ